jgi:hypothetical protein
LGPKSGWPAADALCIGKAINIKARIVIEENILNHCLVMNAPLVDWLVE